MWLLISFLGTDLFEIRLGRKAPDTEGQAASGVLEAGTLVTESGYTGFICDTGRSSSPLEYEDKGNRT